MASVELKYDRPTDTFRDYAEAAEKLDKELGEAMLQATGHASGRVGSSLHQRINERIGNEPYPSEGGGHDGRTLTQSISYGNPGYLGGLRVASAKVTAGKGVPYATQLAVGTKSSYVKDSWTIPEEGSSSPVSFIPLDISDYPESSHGTGEYEGYVTLEQVNWTGAVDGIYNSTTGYRYHRATKEDARKSREEVRDMLKYIFQMNFPGLNPYEMGDA